MKINHAFLAVTAIFLGTTPLVHAQELLVNGGFENEPNYFSGGNGAFPNAGYTLMTGNAVPGWTIAPGYAGTMHIAGVYPTIDGNFSLNTDGEGTGGNNVLIYQDFASTLGEAYNFSYLWETWNLGQPDGLQVEVFDTVTSAVLYNGIFPDAANSQIPQSVNTTFAGTGDPLQLQIDELPQSGYNDNAFIVDDFSVTGTAVPDSTGWSAELAAAFLLAGMARRFRVARA